MKTQCFDGTHVYRVIPDKTRGLGIRILVAEADADGTPVGEFVPFVADQATYYKDIAAVLAMFFAQD